MRLDKFFSDCSVFTRSEFSKVVKAKRVKVNGVLVMKPEYNIDENTDIVTLDDKIITYEKYIYCIFHKPAGYVTATYDKRDLTIYELLPEYFLRKKVMPVGRLDKDTEGLLVLTNDGDLCHKLTSPKYEVEKEYYFVLDEELGEKDRKKLELGKVSLRDGFEPKPCKINMINDVSGNIIITEGKYHQIKRMFGACQNKIIYLKRVREGKLTIDNLEKGSFKLIKKEDF